MIRLSILLLLFINISAFGQVYQMDGSVSLISDCGGFFTDSGGTEDNYENNQNFTTTICSIPREGTHVRLTFSKIELGIGDRLCFYDGLDANADSLLCVMEGFNGLPFRVQASAVNNSGCLTISFRSNSSGLGKGWEANIDCIPACQLIQAEISKTTPSPQPDANGWIDICEGERVFFSGKGFYPQNGIIYEQTDANSNFEWDFGDGTFAVGPEVSHEYQKSGGYRVTLNIIDQFGCTNSNFVFRRVRVATRPNFIIGDLPTIACIGDSIQLSGSTSNDGTNSTIEVSTEEGAFLFNGVRSDSLALPDGNGASYKTSIRFTDFTAGQVLNDVADLQSICVNMEHSWLHDMEISITCPSGKSVKLQSQEIINKEVYLGIPEDNDGINPTAGQGLNYCWTPTATKGTLTEFSNAAIASNPNETYHLPAGDYNTSENLEALIGCPLNGDWDITVTDLWEQDNGWIFSWSIEINPDLYPELEVFEPEILDYQWLNNPDIIDYSADVVIARPTSAGTTNYVFEVEDNFGCKHDTSIQINVLPNNHPDCLNCEDHLLQQKTVTICDGESINLGTFIDPITLGVEEYIAYPDYEFSNATHPPSFAYESVIQVSNVSDKEVNNDGSNLISVCIDLASDYNDDLDISLISPNGIVLNLSSDNGGVNDGYLNTCFTANATQLITDPITSPFNGNYQPEESFAKLGGTDINGVWKLKLSDDAGGSGDVNVLKSWSITFLSPNMATFNWLPEDNLSCTGCTNPTVTPSGSTQYILEKNFEGCQVFDTLSVTVLEKAGPANIQDFSLPDGEILVSWSAVTGADSYEVSTNSTDWEPSSGDFFHIIDGFVNDQTANVFIRAVFSEYDCFTNMQSRSVRYLFCDITASLGVNNLITNCVGSEDAFVEISVAMGNPSFTYSLNDGNPQNSNRFENLDVGDYQILVEELVGSCADTLTFSVIEPPVLHLNFNKKDLNCFGSNDGSIEVIPSGGVGGYEVLQWSNSNSKTLSQQNLPGGLYSVTVEDANNCIVMDTIEVIEPLELQAISSNNPVVCFGQSNGGASVKVTDGTPPYRFMWEDGQTGSSAINLAIGNYKVTVTDANNCTQERMIEVSQPEPINIDFQEQPITCTNEADGALLATASGGVGPYEYEWSTNQRNNFTFGLEPDIYKITITDSQGCEEVGRINVQDPLPIIVNPITTPASCFGENNGSATIDIVGGQAPYTFLWNDALAQTNRTAINLEPADYEVIIVDSFGCTINQSVTVGTATALTSNDRSTPATCFDSADGIGQVMVEGGTGNFQYQWENGDTTSFSENLPSGFYKVTIQDENTCRLIDTIEIYAPPKLVVDSITEILPFCNGALDGQLEAHIKGGIAPFEFIWDNGVSILNPYTGVGAGQHSLSIRDGNGCSTLPINFSLSEPAALTLVAVPQDVNCYGGNDGSISLETTGGVAPYSFQWNDNDAQTIRDPINLIAGTYLVEVRDINNCLTTATVDITQPADSLSLTFIQTDTSCFGQDQSQGIVSASGGTGTNYSYNWSTGVIANTANNLPAGPQNITVRDENNCELTEIIDIVEYDSIQFSIIEVKPTCADKADGSLGITPISGGSGNGLTSNYDVFWNTDPNRNQEVINNLAGNTNYEVTVVDTKGCSQKLTRFLESPDSISLILAKEDISCLGANDGQISIGEFVGTANIVDYHWSNNVPMGTQESAINLLPGDYSLQITDANECSTTAFATIEEPSSISLVQSQILPNQCKNISNGQIFLIAEGGTNDLTYQWSNGDNGPNLLNAPAGNYEVSITDVNGCTFTQTFQLVDPDALEGIISTEGLSCSDSRDGTIDISASGGVAPYLYSLDGIDYNGISSIVGLEAKNYKIYIKDKNDCVWESEIIQINQPPPFGVNIRTNTPTISLGDSLELQAFFENNTGNVQFNWSSNTLEAIPCEEVLCRSIIVSPINNTDYEIYAIDANGCETSDKINIQVAKAPRVFVPTGFTPNDDGINDRLIIHGKEGIVVNSFRIYDRWGEEVYNTSQIEINQSTDGWDGTFKGSPMNGGVFAWVLEITLGDNSREVFHGHTTLIR